MAKKISLPKDKVIKENKAKKKIITKKNILKKTTVKTIKPLKVIKAISKKIAKKAIPKKPIKKLVIRKEIKEKKIGQILHFYDKLSVIVIKPKSDLGVGDTVRIKGGKDTNFKQKITSIEIDGKKIKLAKKNQVIGFKIKEKARPGYWVYKIEA
ncbi:MAG: hypothetical protein WCX30_00510 [Candidatus Paceibacterota bacterium]|nr:hypothetical protein [bacterium]